MTQLEVVLDIVMCFGWILTYTLVLIGSQKYKFPLIPLSTQFFITSLEIAVFLGFLAGSQSFSYPHLAYGYWAIIEVSIIYVSFRQRKIQDEQKMLYGVALFFMILVMNYLLKMDHGMLYFTYINTIVGMLFWLYYILDKKYPMNLFSLCIFLVKFLSDVLGGIVYYNELDALVCCIAIALPCIELLFIAIWLYRRFNKEKYDVFYDKYVKYLPKINLNVPGNATAHG